MFKVKSGVQYVIHFFIHNMKKGEGERKKERDKKNTKGSIIFLLFFKLMFDGSLFFFTSFFINKYGYKWLDKLPWGSWYRVSVP